MDSDGKIEKLHRALNRAFLMPEAETLALLKTHLGSYDAQVVGVFAGNLITAVRAKQNRQSPIDAFLREYGLNSEEGIVLMRIAEALLRIPDAATQNRFLQEKLADADWQRHWLHSAAPMVNLATGALLLSSKIEDRIRHPAQHRLRVFDGLLSRLGEPLIREAVKQAMQQLAYRFVIAEDINEAIAQAHAQPAYRHSFDMLGEAALTEEDAERYYRAYQQAIETLSKRAKHSDLFANPGISVKLSALYPRYEPLQHRRAIPELQEKLLALAIDARAANISLTVDAEEAERLHMSLQIFARASGDAELAGWPGLGLAVQAYQKSAIEVIDWLAALAETQKRVIPLRLVKGAYWDSEIKHAQELGWKDYPVFTRKAATDVCFLACARLLLSRPDVFYPQFATHNAYSVAAICCFAKQHPGFEFQRLHGMGEALYEALAEHQTAGNIPCRVYAPVGNYKDLLPYLVRRLLENGANTSFVNRIENPEIDAAELIRDPLEELRSKTKTAIPPPPELFGVQRKNSQGLNLSDPRAIMRLQQQLDALSTQQWHAEPLINGQPGTGDAIPVYNPCDRRMQVGTVVNSSMEQVDHALAAASQAFEDWRLCPVITRAAYLQQAAELLESHRLELVSLCCREGGRTVRDALAEVREAVDFCRYYAANATALCAPQTLPGPVGEDNRLLHYGRGVFACISPWNFPIAIFVGQIAAALITGNTVIAKPAQPTPLTAMLCIRLLHQTGIPGNVLHFLPGDGASIGKRLLSDERIAGVVFTGSTSTARGINRQLAARESPIAPFIAETGGQNAMIADSSAHEEQLVADALQSAFNSAGQRCSALRVLFLPHETADAVITRLIGAMRLLRLGDPSDTATDVGPVIDRRAADNLKKHVDKLRSHAKVLYQLPLPKELLENGSFFPPTLAELPDIALLDREVFGPILHIVRYRSQDLEKVVAAVNATGYGLTLGIHTRLNDTIQRISETARVGNIYVNRNMIGAVVGVQPFGGMGLSGTGPKAGGPDYLARFTVEQTLTVNTTAIGGNPWLLSRDS